jgi:hypothetical protein
VFCEQLKNFNYGLMMEAMLSGDLGLLRVVAAWAYTCGLPPRNKEMAMSSMLSVLPVQPYDIMGSVLTN